MGLSEELVGKNSTERAAMKAAALYERISTAIATAAATGKTYKFNLKDGRAVVVEKVQIGILGPAYICTPRTDGGADPIWVKVEVDGVYLNGDGWYGFVNPPIMVPDSTTYNYEIMPGITIKRPNLKEDLVLAAKTIIAHAVGGEV